MPGYELNVHTVEANSLVAKAGLAAGPGAVLNEDVQTAISDSGTVVGVVLNTIDDALREDGIEKVLSDRGQWGVQRLPFSLVGAPFPRMVS